MATTTINYSSNTAITLDLSSLAASSTFVAGRESTEIDNTTNKYMDCFVNVLGITGSASAATVGQQIVVYLWGADTSLATTPIDTLDGVDSAETITLPTLQSLKFAASAYTTVTTASQVYYIQPFSVASKFGGIMPKYWGLYVATSLTGGLAASMSGKFSYNGIKYDVA